MFGASNYTDPDIPDLVSPANDLDHVAHVLKERYAFAVETYKNVTRTQLLDRLEVLSENATECEAIIIYYAGHGKQDDAQGYWLPVDADDRRKSNWISNSDIVNRLKPLKARHVWLIADSCFAATLLRDVGTPGGHPLLNKAATKKSRIVFTSGGLEPVLDDGGKRGTSIFADKLVEALTTSNQRYVALRDLAPRVRELVSEVVNQTPEWGPLRNVGHENGDFILQNQAISRRLRSTSAFEGETKDEIRLFDHAFCAETNSRGGVTSTCCPDGEIADRFGNCCSLGSGSRNGSCVSLEQVFQCKDPYECASNAERLHRLGNDQGAFGYAKMACKMGVSRACSLKGVIRYRASVIDAATCSLLDQGCQRDHELACGTLAQDAEGARRCGIPFRDNWETMARACAIEPTFHSCRPLSAVWLGDDLLVHDSVEPALRSACVRPGQGAWACRTLGIGWAERARANDEPQQWTYAIEAFQRGCDAGDGRSCWLGSSSMVEAPREARPTTYGVEQTSLLARGCRAADAWSCFNVAHLLSAGEDGIAINLSYAISFAREACHIDNTYCEYQASLLTRIGTAYANARIWAKSIEAYEEACALEDAVGCARRDIVSFYSGRRSNRRKPLSDLRKRCATDGNETACRFVRGHRRRFFPAFLPPVSGGYGFIYSRDGDANRYGVSLNVYGGFLDIQAQLMGGPGFSARVGAGIQPFSWPDANVSAWTMLQPSVGFAFDPMSASRGEPPRQGNRFALVLSNTISISCWGFIRGELEFPQVKGAPIEGLLTFGLDLYPGQKKTGYRDRRCARQFGAFSPGLRLL